MIDLEKLPTEVRNSMKFIPVDTIDEVFANALQKVNKKVVKGNSKKVTSSHEKSHVD
jgi:ATP-dependent Lon protease